MEGSKERKYVNSKIKLYNVKSILGTFYKINKINKLLFTKNLPKIEGTRYINGSFMSDEKSDWGIIVFLNHVNLCSFLW